MKQKQNLNLLKNFSKYKNQLFKSVLFLYVVLIVAIMNVVMLFQKNDNESVFLFIIISACTYFAFDKKNMIVALLAPLIIVNLLLFVRNQFPQKNLEGLEPEGEEEEEEEDESLKEAIKTLNKQECNPKLFKTMREILKKGDCKDTDEKDKRAMLEKYIAKSDHVFGAESKLALVKLTKLENGSYKVKLMDDDGELSDKKYSLI